MFGNGGAGIAEPTNGEIVAGPLYGEEGMLAHDCDLRLGLHAKRVFTAVGHYSRDDVLAPPAPGDSVENGVAVSPEAALR